MPDSNPPRSPASALLYSTADIDRAGHRRTDPDWLAEARAARAALFVSHWQGRLLVETGEAPRAVFAARPVADAGHPEAFLGLLGEAPVFAADLSAAADPLAVLEGARGSFEELRGLAGVLPAHEAGLLATAKALFHWHSRQRFCGRCGGECVPERAGHVMRCTKCSTEHFPRTDPAVIMLITRIDADGEELALLGQSQRFPPERNMYSTLAGFVEPGESLEDAVRREVAEEVGVAVGRVTYRGSQPWPFPASLMLGFRGEAESEAIVLDDEEMRDAGWFSRADVEARRERGFNIPPKDSIARRLVDEWMSEA